MQRILRRWQRVVVEEAASEQPGPPAPGLWGELYLREVVVRMAVLSSLLPPLGCPAALTATLPPPFLLPTSSWLAAGVCQWGCGSTHCSWVFILLGGGREGCGGAGLFVLECGVVQWAVEPLGLRDE